MSETGEGEFRNCFGRCIYWDESNHSTHGSTNIDILEKNTVTELMASQSSSKTFGLLAGLTALIGVIYAIWWRKHPSPCPYSQRFWVQLPRPIITRSRLRAILAPQPGERILEVGPGTGYYSLSVAQWLDPHGTLHVIDVQQEMLDQIRTRARPQGGRNIALMNADAQHLPYSDDSFDAAYLVLVLGEVPDQEQAL